jgi:D-alanyl-D-alanine carboxypeptidase
MSRPDRPVSKRRLQLALAAALVLAPLALPPEPSAHLAMIRQGLESADQPEAEDRFGWAVASGDFDNDGYDDLATGAPRDDVNSGNEIGNVVVSPGSPWGLTHEGAYERGLAFLPQPTVHFGHALAVGDFDNDTYDDLAVGAPYLDHNGATDAGRIYVFYGSATGLEQNYDIFDHTDFGVLESPENGDLFGWALAAGDFDGDLDDDLAVGAIGEDNESGAVYVLYGSVASGLTSTGARIFRQSSFGETDTPMDHFGHALATGQVTLTPDIDLVIGTPNHGSLNGGRVYVLPSYFGDLNIVVGSWFDAASLGVPVSTLDSHFGWSLALGFFMTETGGMDIAVGEPGYPTNALAESGRVVVASIHLPVAAASASAAKPPTADAVRDAVASSASTAMVITQDHGFATYIPEAGDQFGWALASGDFDAFSREDLAVGSPGETWPLGNLNFVGTGVVQVFRTGVGPAFPSSVSEYEANELFDRASGQSLGHSVAFGNFDGDPDRLNLAVGAPTQTFDYWINAIPPLLRAGSVTIIAPQRQIYYTRARGASLLDCDGNPVFSVRPFDAVQAASTVKLVTTWIAADHILWGLVDSTDAITTHSWIANCYNGSSVPLTDHEYVQLIDLMKMAISVSGGDACYAIGDLITGDTWAFPSGDDCDPKNEIPFQIPAFIDTMNARAAALGGVDTEFNNPGGRPYAKNNIEPHSTAYDMALIGRASMQNPIMRYIVGTPSWVIIRALQLPNMVSVVKDTLNNSWLQSMQNLLPSVNGIKPGNNSPSLQTRVASARADTLGRDVIASIMGVKLTDSDDISGGYANTKAAEMCSLGVALCGAVPPPIDRSVPPPAPLMQVRRIPADSSGARGAIFTMPDVDDEVLVGIYREESTTPETGVNLLLERSFEAALDPGETVTINVSPFDSTCGVRVDNVGNTSASLHVIHNQPATVSYPLNLGSGEDSLVVGPSNVAGSFALTVQNTSSTERDTLRFEEVCWQFEVLLGDGGLGGPDFFETSIQVDGPHSYQTFAAHVFGKDPAPGNTVILVVREPGSPTGVLDDPRPDSRTPDVRRVIAGLRSYPNPSNPSTTIEYELTATSDVRVDVYDVSGRFLRTLERARRKAAGVHRVPWDGTDRFGNAVASGVYFYRVRASGETRASRLVVLK